ncbi:MAG: helix-turn-helix domain-containing protein [Exilibacterium sp.]
MTTLPRTIPRYALYGDDSQIQDIEFVHIEDIVSRSKLYDWEIAAHTHMSLLQIMVIVNGGAEALLDDRKSQITGPCVVLLPAGTVHGFHFDPDTQGKIVSVAAGFIEHSVKTTGNEILGEVIHQALVLPYQKSPGRFQTIKNLINQIHAEFRYPQMGRSIIFESLLRTLLVYIYRHSNRKQRTPSTRSLNQTVFNRYRALIEEHYKERRLVAEFANDMHVTESKLNRICQMFANKTAFEVLQERVLLEAQRYLIYTTAPLTEIAYDLGFNDAAYFCRYFKKRTGITPKLFRAKNSE